LLAQFAYWLKPLWWNKTHTFSIIQQLCIAEFDLLRPQGAGDMHPVVPSCSLEGFSRVDGAACSLLLHSPTATSFLNDFALDAFLLTVPISFLLMRRLQRLHELLMRKFDWAENTFVSSGNLQVVVVSAHVAEPRLSISFRPHSITRAVYMQPAIATLEQFLTRHIDNSTYRAWMDLNLWGVRLYWRWFLRLFGCFLLLRNNVWCRVCTIFISLALLLWRFFGLYDVVRNLYTSLVDLINCTWRYGVS
jgi:hypothetical protein